MHRLSFTTVGVALCVWMGLAVSAHAQLELTTRLAHRVYLQFEPVEAATTVRSRIGQPVVFNTVGNSPRFYYEVRDDYGIALPLKADVVPPDPMMVAPQDVVIFTNDMTRLYAMGSPGQYTIQPCVDWMGKTYRGDKRHVEVVSGREITRITGIVPADNATRTYKIFHINRGHQDHILLRIDDESAGVCFGVYKLGRSVLNEQPQLAVDAKGSAHILFQSAPRTYTHAIYSPRGVVEGFEVFDPGYSLVRLESQPNGSINAVGKRDTGRQPPMVNSVIENR